MDNNFHNSILIDQPFPNTNAKILSVRQVEKIGSDYDISIAGNKIIKYFSILKMNSIAGFPVYIEQYTQIKVKTVSPSPTTLGTDNPINIDIQEIISIAPTIKDTTLSFLL